MPEWNPDMDAAPRGVEVLLYEPEVRAGRRHSLPARIVIGSYPASYPREATHWQPLPEPPIKTDTGETG